MTHMPLDEYDRRVKPFLNTICGRAGWVAADTRQIREWVESLMVVPDFHSEARDRLDSMRRDLSSALSEIDRAIEIYDSKPKVT